MEPAKNDVAEGQGWLTPPASAFVLQPGGLLPLEGEPTASRHRRPVCGHGDQCFVQGAKRLRSGVRLIGIPDKTGRDF